MLVGSQARGTTIIRTSGEQEHSHTTETEVAPLRRRELIGFVAVGVILLAVALLALRFDVASLMLAGASSVPDSAKASTTAAPQPAREKLAATKARDAQPSLASGGKAAVAEPPASAPAAPSSKFDVVRIDPDGASVFAGRAPANSQVTVLANDKPVATAKADETGAWATVIDKRLPTGEVQLSLRSKSSGPAAESPGQSVRITIAAAPPAARSEVKPGVPAPRPPAPITFVYDEATFTDPGRKEMVALTEFLRQRRLETVTLSGHADSRGSDAYNMELSRQRLEAVARHLREAGYKGKLVLVPKGKREPYATPDRAKLSEEEAYQLDRRVELHASP